MIKQLYDELSDKREPVAVVGLGYVGLPLALHLGRKFKVIGFDINESLIARLKQREDATGEVPPEDFEGVDIHFTAHSGELKQSRFLIVAVPTPIDQANIPDLRPMTGASETIGRNLREGAVVVYESTVYPGVTEDVCGPILERESGLRAGKDFFLGYSPERINPGDKVHTFDKIVKVVSGQTPEVLDLAARVYGDVVTAGIHRAPDIKTAEAAKVIENTQRDLNIALMNELAIIFNKIGIDTNAVLEAAGTKWNFLKFTPGLVGGHCIGVDPYYLTYLAGQIGYHPQVILAGRRINDGMGAYVAKQTVKRMIKGGARISGAPVLVLGLTFKEDVADMRNSKVFEVVRELRDFDLNVSVHDPMADREEVATHYGEHICTLDPSLGAEALILAVRHKTYLDMGLEKLATFAKPGAVLVDVKGCYSEAEAEAAGLRYWSL